MEEDEPLSATEKFERALNDMEKASYLLRLYIAGNTEKSARAIENIREICEKNLHGRYTLEVIDIHQQPELARGEQIIAAPTLIKSLPLPLRRIIGDLSQTERIMVSLNLQPIHPSPTQDQEDQDGKK